MNPSRKLLTGPATEPSDGSLVGAPYKTPTVLSDLVRLRTSFFAKWPPMRRASSRRRWAELVGVVWFRTFFKQAFGIRGKVLSLGQQGLKQKKAALAIRIGFYNAGYLMGFWCELSACDDIKEPFCNALGP